MDQNQLYWPGKFSHIRKFTLVYSTLLYQHNVIKLALKCKWCMKINSFFFFKKNRYVMNRWKWYCYTTVHTNCSNTTVIVPDSLWEETVPGSACFGLQCSVTPTRGEELEQVVTRLWWICRDASGRFPDSGLVQDLERGHAGSDDSLCSPDCPL